MASNVVPDIPETPTDQPDNPALPDEPDPDVEILPKEEEKALLDLIQDYEKRAMPIRESQLRLWKKLEFFFRGIQKIYWSEIAHDWRLPPIGNEREIDDSLSTRDINIYRAHAESIIAALSTGVPVSRFFPDDANNPIDICTAKEASKISELIQTHNESPLQFIRALYTLFNQSFVASYVYHHESDDYGTWQKPSTTMEDANVTDYFCPQCGTNATSEITPPEQTPPELPCPTCASPTEMGPPQPTKVPRISWEDNPKSREIIEVYGPLNVKIPPRARTQKAIPYLILETEHDASLLKEIYPLLEDKIEKNVGGYENTQERWARDFEFSDLAEEDSEVTSKRVWLRKWALNGIKDKALRKSLKTKYPKGSYSVWINGNLAEILEENLDDRWSITVSPLSHTLHADPLGKPLAPIQELRSEVVDLEIETMEFGIPETFADPQVINFNAYKDSRAAPGQMFPAKPRVPGTSLEGAFHTIKTATLSGEIQVIKSDLDRDGQFVVGSFPSVFGGPQEMGSKTASEYSQSRANALQRLSIPWKMILSWWSQTMKKAVKSYIDNIKYDEQYSRTNGSGYMAVVIAREKLKGKIGNVEPEVSEAFPISWAQKGAKVEQLMTLNNELVNAVLADSQNSEFIGRVEGLPELRIPGADDRNKQLYEIAEMLKSPPVMDQVNMMPAPSIPPDFDIDNGPICVQTIRSWAISPEGIATKQDNPQGYQNVMLQLKARLMFQAQQDAAAAANAIPPGGGPGSEKGKASPPKNKPSDMSVAPPPGP